MDCLILNYNFIVCFVFMFVYSGKPGTTAIFYLDVFLKALFKCHPEQRLSALAMSNS